MRSPFPSERLQRITRLAARSLDLPIALVSLTGTDGRERTTCYGIEATEVERDPAFCTYALLSQDVLVVEDAREDARFAASELVAGEQGIRFYAGASLCAEDGATLGTLCVMDTHPHSFDDRDRDILRDLAATVVDEVARCRADMLRQHLFEGHPQPMFVYDVETLGFVDVNAAAVEVYGYSREQFLQMTIADIRPEEDVPALHRNVEEAPDGREVTTGWRHRRSDGSLVDVEVTSYPIHINGRAARHVQVRDVTDREEAARALGRRDAMLRASGAAAECFLKHGVWDEAAEGVLRHFGETVEVDRVYLAANDRDENGALCRDVLYEWARPGVASSPPRRISYEEVGLAPWVEPLRGQQVVHSSAADVRGVGRLEERGVTTLAAAPIFVRGTWWGFIGFDICTEGRNWTEPELEALKMMASMLGAVIGRDEAERALRASEQRYRTLIEQASDGILISKEPHGCIEVNEQACKMTGYSREELLQMRPEDLITEADLGKHPLDWRSYDLGQTQRHERELLRKDGTVFPVEVNAKKIEGGLVQAILRDITERKRAEAALRESEQHFRAIFEKGPLGMCLIDTERCLIRVNDALCDTLGYTEAELIGRSVNEIAPSKVVDASRRRTDALFAGGADNYQVEKRYLRHDGSAVWMRVTTAVLRDEDGEARFGLGMFEDITERKEQQRQIIEAKHHAEEMNRIKSAFLANMSHEIRTPLTAITGFAEILGEEVSPQNREFVELISDSSKRLMDTLNSILDLAQLESESMQVHPESFDLVDLVDEQVGVYRIQAERQGIRLRLEAPARPVPVEFDPSVMGRVLHNLVSNALKFTEEGSVTVGVEREQGQVRLSVRDTGVGIDPSFVPYVFDEFKQESSGLTRNYDGTGLGLAITKRLVEIMGGRIEVKSVKARGTTFTVTLPVEAGAGVEEEQAAERSGRPRVLAVDDNDHTRHLLHRMIEANYAVDTVAAGDEALKRAARTRYDVVLMDVSLGGGLSGEEVMGRLRQRADYADVPVVAVTAHALPGDRERLLRAGFDGYVAKPFTRRQILEALADGLKH